MLMRVIIPGELIKEQIEPYKPVLESLAFEPAHLISYSLEALHYNDYSHINHKLREDYLAWGTLGDTVTMDQVEGLDKAIHGCIDAIDDVLHVLEPEVNNLFGRVPKSLMLHGMLGDDLVLGVLTDDTPKTSPHPPEPCVL